MGKKETEEMFFVSINNAVGLRRAILESSKLLIDCLQRQARLRKIRAEKLEHMDRALAIMKEINERDMVLFNIQDIKIPLLKKAESGKYDALDVQKTEKKAQQRKIDAGKIEDDEPNPELRKLKKAIEDIEAQLSSMG